MAAVFNYVPFLGPTAVTTLLVLAGIGTFPDLVDGLLPAAVFVAIILLEGQIITPHVVGRRMTMHPLAVFLAIAFWAWVWGPLGAFVAVPLMVIATVIVAHLFPSEEVNLPG
jgi:predicted PurR-regulated permease PerM